MIDRVNIQNGIRTIAEEIFITKEISNDDVDIFVKDIVRFITNEFDGYICKNEHDYICFIPEDRQKDFKDFSNGYVRQMQEWMDENPLDITRIEIPIEQIVETLPNGDAVKKALKIAGICTIMAIGISFFAPASVAIIAEFIALGIAYKVYKSQNNLREIHKIEPNIDEIKEEIINCVIKDANSWLDKAERMSSELYESYK